MTISTTSSQITYAGDAVTLDFAFPYPFIATSDLRVYVNGVQQFTGFSVAGSVPFGGSGTFASGTVSFLVAPAALATVLIYSDPDQLQSTSLPPNDPFPSKTVEKMVDKLTLLIQAIYRKFGNAITFPPGDLTSGVLPSAANRANKGLFFDALGVPYVAVPASGTAAALALLLADTTLAGNGPALVGMGILPYGVNTVGGALFTTVWGAGATDRAAQFTAANALGLPIRIIGSCTVSSPVTITVPIVDTMAQIFATTAQITIDNGLPVRPEWFGSATGNIRLAVNSLPNAGGVVQLSNKTYPPSYNTATAAMFNARTGTPGLDYMVKKRVRILGTKLPEYASTELAMQSGTIIQGPLYISSECDGLELDLFGVDSGTTVVNALYAGAEQDGLAIVQVNKTTPLLGKGFIIGNVRGLCKIGSVGVHAVLLEAMDGGTIGYAEGRRGFHGVAYKSRNMTVGSLVGHGCGGEDVIVKSDTYAVMSDTEIGNLVSGGLTGVEAGVGVQIQAGTLGLGSLQVGNVYTLRKDYALVVVAGGQVIADINIANLIGASCTFGGYQLSGDCRRVKVGNATLNAVPTGVIITGATDRSNAITSLTVSNATTGIDLTGKLQVDKAHFDTVTNAIVYSSAGSALYLGAHTEVTVTNFWALTPALAGTWAQHAGGDTFKATIENGRVVLSGLVQGGAATTVVAALDARIRPAQNYRYSCLAFNGATYATVEVAVTTAGLVGISTLAPTTGGYLSLSGVNWPIPF